MTPDPYGPNLGGVSDATEWATVDYRGCPCGPMPQADGYAYGCPVHDPNPPTRNEETR